VNSNSVNAAQRLLRSRVWWRWVGIVEAWADDQRLVTAQALATLLNGLGATHQEVHEVVADSVELRVVMNGSAGSLAR
jgi:hypothetical protein